MADDHHLALHWAAGLFEGEGWASVITPSGRKPYGTLGLRMTDVETVEKFAAIMPRGTAVREMPRRNPQHKDSFLWQTAKRADIEWFAEHICPLLGERRQAQVRAALAASRECARRYTHSLAQEMFGKRFADLEGDELRAYRRESMRLWRKTQSDGRIHSV